ncbi:BRO-N domain-containing protein, partial [Mesomycoplasma ovipneumoniae]|uniref:BRO-N domain-containing protein n=1 Tax=Mesomycoplasma ovipneumoniae TaxID=29562 RepID=UPI0030807C7C
SNSKDALQKLVSSEYKKQLSEINDISVGMQNTSQPKIDYHAGKAVYLSEPGVYEFIFASKTEFAKSVKRWVFEEVLPSIRKNGTYQLNKQLQEKEQQLVEQMKALQIAESKNLQLTTRIKESEQIKPDGWIYIATTKQYSQNNQYKLGKTKTLNPRM